jgi:F-type H+-transporting ATPase subunit c
LFSLFVYGSIASLTGFFTGVCLSMSMDAQTAYSLTAPLAVGLASIGPAIGISLMTAAYFNSSARQPEMQPKLAVFYYITLGVVELLGLFGFIISILVFLKVVGF